MIEGQQELGEIEFSFGRCYYQHGPDNHTFDGTVLTVRFSVGCPSHGHKNTTDTLALARHTHGEMEDWLEYPQIIPDRGRSLINTPNPYSIGCSECGVMFIVTPRSLERLKEEGQEWSSSL